MQSGTSESDSQPILGFTLGSDSGHFRVLPQAIFSFYLKASMKDRTLQPQRKLLFTTRSAQVHSWVCAICYSGQCWAACSITLNTRVGLRTDMGTSTGAQCYLWIKMLGWPQTISQQDVSPRLLPLWKNKKHMGLTKLSEALPPRQGQEWEEASSQPIHYTWTFLISIYLLF